MVKLLIADDHKVLLDGFISIFKNEPDIDVVCTAKDGKQVLELLETTEIDIALLDINMPILNGVETCKKITKKYPDVKVIAISMYKQASYIKRMKQNGAKGYLLKDDNAEELIKAIKKVYSGEEYYSAQLIDVVLQNTLGSNSNQNYQLTNREKEVVKLIAQGQTNKQIGDLLFISIHTVDSHRKKMLSKLRAKNSAELVRMCLEKGLI